MFSSPINLYPDITYMLSYYAANGVHAYSGPFYSFFPEVVYPLRVASFGSAIWVGPEHIPPSYHDENNYYIEPIIEWEEEHPVFVPDPTESYYDQWVNGAPSKPFHFSVFFADPEFLVEYAAMGITTLIAGTAHPGYVAAVKAANMDHYVAAGQYPHDDRTSLEMAMAAMAEDPVYAAHVKGYHIDDEPDLTFPYRPPELNLQWIQELRRIDSTRPTMLGFSFVVAVPVFYSQPQGVPYDSAQASWKQWAALPDILMGDFYTLSSGHDLNPSGHYGVWMYAKFTERLRMLGEGRNPILATIETTAQRPNQPDPADVVKACWASLIAGAQGIIFFDHRFGDQYVTQDFAAMLHDPPMKAALSALIVRGNLLADALHSPEAGLCTGYTSSNTTSGPMGGTYGVPMHYTTRDDGVHEYLFAMGIRPGATTATFTIPSWAGETVTVLDESRTVTVDGSGVLTDTFAANYTVHLYQL
jgi:hypothetical protein